MKGRMTLAMLAAAAAGPTAAAAAETATYRYDARGRLIEVARTGGVNGPATSAHAFDQADNRIGATVTGTSGPIAAPRGVIVLPGTSYRIVPIR